MIKTGLQDKTAVDFGFEAGQWAGREGPLLGRITSALEHPQDFAEWSWHV